MDEGATKEEGRSPSAESQLFEVGVFILLILPSLLLPYFVGKGLRASFVVIALGTILHNLAFLCLIAFFMWKNHEPMGRLGLRGWQAGREITVGLCLFLLMFLSLNLIEESLTAAGISLPSRPLPSFLTTHSPGGYGLALALVIVAAVSEETIFRGYLMLRLAAVTRSRLAAALLSTLVFALGHGYEGVAGVVAVFFIGLFLCAVYTWRGSLIAPMVIHFLQDFVGLFIVPFSTHFRG